MRERVLGAGKLGYWLCRIGDLERCGQLWRGLHLVHWPTAALNRSRIHFIQFASCPLALWLAGLLRFVVEAKNGLGRRGWHSLNLQDQVQATDGDSGALLHAIWIGSLRPGRDEMESAI